jgi:acetylornithine deacetylase/succinyl-diaminopimelate desuccinylase-like protein
MTLRARGTGGHGSIPNADNAVAHIGEVARRLIEQPTPMHVGPVMRHFIDALARTQPAVRGAVLRQMTNPLLSALILDRVLPDREQARLFHALLHNTATPTVCRAGESVNVVPAVAELDVDGRTLPGQTSEDLVAEVRAIVGDDIEIEVTRSLPAMDGDPADPVLAVIQEVMDQLDPGVTVVPNIMPGFTDAKAWSRLGCVCFGFAPVKLAPDLKFSELFHGVDERIPVEGFRFGVRALVEVVARVAG